MVPRFQFLLPCSATSTILRAIRSLGWSCGIKIVDLSGHQAGNDGSRLLSRIRGCCRSFRVCYFDVHVAVSAGKVSLFRGQLGRDINTANGLPQTGGRYRPGDRLSPSFVIGKCHSPESLTPFISNPGGIFPLVAEIIIKEKTTQHHIHHHQHVHIGIVEEFASQPFERSTGS